MFNNIFRDGSGQFWCSTMFHNAISMFINQGLTMFSNATQMYIIKSMFSKLGVEEDFDVRDTMSEARQGQPGWVFKEPRISISYFVFHTSISHLAEARAARVSLQITLYQYFVFCISYQHFSSTNGRGKGSQGESSKCLVSAFLYFVFLYCYISHLHQSYFQWTRQGKGN